MKVRRFYRPGATWASPTESLRDAAKKMRRGGSSCLPVLDGDFVVGVVTDRDMVEAVAKGVSPSDAIVNDYMNDVSAVTVSLDDDSSVAEMKMLAIGCSHLPVVDRGRLVGIVSARDLFLIEARAEMSRPAPALVAVGADDGGWPAEPPPDVDSEP